MSNPHANRIQLLANKIKTIIGESPNLKDFSRYNSLKNLTQVRKKNNDYASAFETQQSLI
jgi:hypothetical protein